MLVSTSHGATIVVHGGISMTSFFVPYSADRERHFLPGLRVYGRQNSILIEFNGNNPYLLFD